MARDEQDLACRNLLDPSSVCHATVGFAFALVLASSTAVPASAQSASPYGHAYDFAAGKPHADSFHPAETWGPAISQGFGNQYGGIGLQVGYYFVPKEQPYALYAYASFGLAALMKDYSIFGGVGGVTGLYGRKHRWAVDLSYGIVGTTWLTLYGEKVAARPLYGLSLSVGREWMWATHLFFRVLVGATYVTDDSPAFEASDHWGPALTLGFGWKPW